MADEERHLADRLMATGADIAGNLASVGIGMLLGGPPGALVGAGAAPFVASVIDLGAEFTRRHLAPREAKRVGALMAFALERVQQNINAGMSLRDDDFFPEEAAGGRSTGDEVVEEIARVVQRQAQEKKIRYLGNMLGNIAFDSDIDPVTAHRVVSIAEALSYTQFQLLALYLRDDVPLPEKYVHGIECSWYADSVALDLMNLGFGQRELLLPGEGELLAIAQQRLTPLGGLVSKLLGLSEIPPNETLEVAAALWERQGAAPPWRGSRVPSNGPSS